MYLSYSILLHNIGHTALLLLWNILEQKQISLVYVKDHNPLKWDIEQRRCMKLAVVDSLNALQPICHISVSKHSSRK